MQIWVDADEAALRAALTADTVEGKAPVDVSASGPGRYRVVLEDRDISGVVRALVAGEIEVRQIRDLGTNLDQIYRQYFEEHEEHEKVET